VHTAFLLAAGHGTRLRPLTLARPKPLLPVCGIPMLDYALAHVRAHGHSSVLVNAHHLWPQVAAWAEKNEVSLQVELPEILGTGGGLRAALETLGESVVVVNADILSDVDLTALTAAIPPDGAAMALRPHADADRIGPVLADAAGRVVRITTVVPSTDGVPGTHFTGVHAMSRAAVARVPADGEQCVVRTAYKEMVPEGRVGCIAHRGSWIDVGTPEAYLSANLDVLSGHVRPPVDPWSHGAHGPGGSWVGAGADVAGTIERSIIGAGAHVPADATVVRTVVWDGVSVPAGRHEGCIIYDGGAVLDVGSTARSSA
jgi:mannose-1-phosphate guanylyltransferase